MVVVEANQLLVTMATMVSMIVKMVNAVRMFTGEPITLKPTLSWLKLPKCLIS